MVGALIGAGASILGNVLNAASQQQTNQANISNQDRVNAQNIALQERFNAIQRDREDTQYSRAVDDLRSAGLSPLLAANNGFSFANVSAPVSTDSATIGSPSFDLSGIGSSVQNAQRIKNEITSIKNIKDFNNRMSDLKETEIGIKHMEFLDEQQRIANEFEKAQNDKKEIERLNREMSHNIAIMEVATRKELSYAHIKADEQKYKAEIKAAQDRHYREISLQKQYQDRYFKHDTARQISANVNMVWRNTLATINPVANFMQQTATNARMENYLEGGL